MDSVNGGRVLSVVDYVIFSSMLLVSSLIGIYCAYRDRKRKNEGTEGYLMANRSMPAAPVAISLAVSFQSAITVLGVPAETFYYGLMYGVWSSLGIVFSGLVACVVFVPVLYHLGISSAYEYLEKRFNMSVRLVSSGFFILLTFVFTAVNIYAPALALSGVTGFGLTPAMLSTGFVCIFYTTLGGLRGVIWADVFQGIMMAVGLLSVAIQGSIQVGGFQEVWRIASDGGRTFVAQFDIDPRIRCSAWSVGIGSFVSWLGVWGTNQAQVQRLLSVKSQTNSVKAMCMGMMGQIMYTMMAAICGLVMYAFYSSCDPLAAECIRKGDELMPYAVMEFFHDYSGMPGVFLACVYSASLSSASSAINALVTVVVEDFVKPYTKWTGQQYKRLSTGFGLLFGIMALGLSFLASVVDSIVAFAAACFGAFTGPTLGIFLLGIWFPFANVAGALCGYLTGGTLAMILLVGSSHTRLPSYLDRRLDISTEYCTANCSYIEPSNLTAYNREVSPSNVTDTYPDDHSELIGIQNFYAISFFYIAPIGFAVTLLVGIVISLLTGGWKQRLEVDKKLLYFPFESKVFHWIPDGIRRFLRCGVSTGIKNTIKVEECEVTELTKADTSNPAESSRPTLY